jgi:hypothetical protein
MSLRLSPLALVAMVLLLGDGCGDAEKSVPPGSSRLLVQQIVEPGHGVPIEGEYSYVRIEDSGGYGIAQERLPRDGKTTVRLEPGSYRLISYQRYCDGNCGYLDPPSDRCSNSFTIAGDKALNATVRVTFGLGCKIGFVP